MISEEYEPETNGGAPPASSFASCLRKCKACGIAVSNARGQAITIYRDPRDNVPEQVRGDVLDVLARVLNIDNRCKKHEKFASENSEDAVTWTVFRYLQASGLLAHVAHEVTLAGTRRKGDGALLLWGVPIPVNDPRGVGIRAEIERLLEAIGERSNRFSEPDVLIDFDVCGLVVVEVKYRSGNDWKDPRYRGWPTYTRNTDAFIDSDRLVATRCYELARYWRLGWDLAGERPFTLLNLGPPSLFVGPEGKRLDQFEACLPVHPTRRFMRVTWDQLVEAVPDPPEWFTDYVQKRSLRN